MVSAPVPMEDLLTTSETVNLAFLDALNATHPPLVKLAMLLSFSKEILVSVDVDLDTSKMDLSVLLAHLDVLCAMDPISVSSVWLDN